MKDRLGPNYVFVFMIIIPTLCYSHLSLFIPHREVRTVTLIDDIVVTQFASLSPDRQTTAA